EHASTRGRSRAWPGVATSREACVPKKKGARGGNMVSPTLKLGPVEDMVGGARGLDGAVGGLAVGDAAVGDPGTGAFRLAAAFKRTVSDPVLLLEAAGSGFPLVTAGSTALRGEMPPCGGQERRAPLPRSQVGSARRRSADVRQKRSSCPASRPPLLLSAGPGA